MVVVVVGGGCCCGLLLVVMGCCGRCGSLWVVGGRCGLLLVLIVVFLFVVFNIVSFCCRFYCFLMVLVFVGGCDCL